MLGSSRRSSQLHTLCKPKLAILGQIHPGASQTNVVPPILGDVEAAPLQYLSLSATPRLVALPLSLSPSDHRLGRLFSAESATSKVTLRSELVGHGETPVDKPMQRFGRQWPVRIIQTKAPLGPPPIQMRRRARMVHVCARLRVY